MTYRPFVSLVVALAFVSSACSSSGTPRPAATTIPNTTRTTTTFLPAEARCPARSAATPANAGVVGLGSRLVPLTATRLEVCRYDLVSRPGTLREHFSLVDHTTITQFERAANALPSTGPGVYSCPNDNGSAMIVIFENSSRSVSVRVSLSSGCRLVTNGTRTVQSSPRWATTVANIKVANCPNPGPQGFATPTSSPVAGIDRTLVPIRATSARVCRYTPHADSHPNTLDGFGVLTDAAVTRRFEAIANALHHISNAERIPCPMNPVSPSWFVSFDDATAHVDLLLSQNGCGFTTNGSVTAVSARPWLDALARVTTLH